ncbi:DUF3298 and DUF4163 domain-containing protein [Priestia koreensis]|uniref:DUF3298 and DUF4163 domain-containing protein n=1 Tax=Priestia koreensis TaxID=284581 RepID=UPI003019F6B0
MKKVLAGTVAASLLLGFGAASTSHASTMTQPKAVQSLDPIKGQIGTLTVKTDTQMWKKEKDGSLTKARMLKAGEEVRVFSMIDDMYYVGSYQYVKPGTSVTYSAVPQQEPVKVVKKMYKNKISYPQVTGMANTQAQARINRVLSMHAERSYNASVSLKKEEAKAKKDYDGSYPWYAWEYYNSYEIKFNMQGKLSVMMNDGEYTGGAHGIYWLKSYNFDTNTGERYSLGTVINHKNSAVQQYAFNYMMNQNGMFDVEKLSDVKIDESRPFYFQTSGIGIMFQPYEVGPYAAGTPAIFIPHTLYTK